MRRPHRQMAAGLCASSPISSRSAARALGTRLPLLARTPRLGERLIEIFAGPLRPAPSPRCATKRSAPPRLPSGAPRLRRCLHRRRPPRYLPRCRSSLRRRTAAGRRFGPWTVRRLTLPPRSRHKRRRRGAIHPIRIGSHSSGLGAPLRSRLHASPHRWCSSRASTMQTPSLGPARQRRRSHQTFAAADATPRPRPRSAWVLMAREHSATSTRPFARS